MAAHAAEAGREQQEGVIDGGTNTDQHRGDPPRAAEKATQFLDAAIVTDDAMPDASVSLLVNAGIAAADVIWAHAWAYMPRRKP